MKYQIGDKVRIKSQYQRLYGFNENYVIITVETINEDGWGNFIILTLLTDQADEGYIKVGLEIVDKRYGKKRN